MTRTAPHPARARRPRAWPLLALAALALGACSPRIAPGTPPPPELAGVWVTGTMSDLTDVGSDGHEVGDRSGTGLYFRFNADGTFGYAYAENVTNAGCTTKFFVYKEGTLEIRGDLLLLAPARGRSTYSDSCNPHTNSDRPLAGAQLETDRYAWRLAPSDAAPGATNLVLTTDSGATGALRRP
jgi:hypothetical protein